MKLFIKYRRALLRTGILFFFNSITLAAAGNFSTGAESVGSEAATVGSVHSARAIAGQKWDPNGPQNRTTPIGAISATDGEVLINGRPAQAGAVVRYHDQVTLVGRSQAQIRFHNNISLKLIAGGGPSTDVVISQEHFQQETGLGAFLKNGLGQIFRATQPSPEEQEAHREESESESLTPMAGVRG